MSDETTYDSTNDTLQHIFLVQELIGSVTSELTLRGEVHDLSKLEPPEKEAFDIATPRLKGTTYGSPEYKAGTDLLDEALVHHYKVNRHHPQFVDRDIKWNQAIGYEGFYEVSNMGDVRSIGRTVKRDGARGDMELEGQTLKAHVTPKGYFRIQLSLGGRSRNHLVHRLVAEAFIGPQPALEYEVNHRNGNKRDNRPSNLEWVTSSENTQHSYDAGLREAAVKFVVHCPELDITTFGANKMAEKLVSMGYPDVTASGVYGAMMREGKHCQLRFEATKIEEYRRSQVSGMNLLDLIEMLADWKAAGARHDDGDMQRSIDINRERFELSDEMYKLLCRTARDLGWL